MRVVAGKSARRRTHKKTWQIQSEGRRESGDQRPQRIQYRLSARPDIFLEQSPGAECSRAVQEDLAVRYFFNIRDGEKTERDLEGSEFDSLELAIDDAQMAAREIMAERVLAGYEPDGQSFDIVDEDGRVLANVPFRSALRPQ